MFVVLLLGQQIVRLPDGRLQLITLPTAQLQQQQQVQVGQAQPRIAVAQPQVVAPAAVAPAPQQVVVVQQPVGTVQQPQAVQPKPVQTLAAQPQTKLIQIGGQTVQIRPAVQSTGATVAQQLAGLPVSVRPSIGAPLVVTSTGATTAMAAAAAPKLVAAPASLGAMQPKLAASVGTMAVTPRIIQTVGGDQQTRIVLASPNMATSGATLVRTATGQQLLIRSSVPATATPTVAAISATSVAPATPTPASLIPTTPTMASVVPTTVTAASPSLATAVSPVTATTLPGLTPVSTGPAGTKYAVTPQVVQQG